LQTLTIFKAPIDQPAVAKVSYLVSIRNMLLQFQPVTPNILVKILIFPWLDILLIRYGDIEDWLERESTRKSENLLFKTGMDQAMIIVMGIYFYLRDGLADLIGGEVSIIQQSRKPNQEQSIFINGLEIKQNFRCKLQGNT